MIGGCSSLSVPCLSSAESTNHISSVCCLQVLFKGTVQTNARCVVFCWSEMLPECNMTSSLSLRISRAASVLLSDPCFQLHSIQHLLGEGAESTSSSAAITSTARPVVGSLGSTVAPQIPSAAGNGSSERKHFSLHACE